MSERMTEPGSPDPIRYEWNGMVFSSPFSVALFGIGLNPIGKGRVVGSRPDVGLIIEAEDTRSVDRVIVFKQDEVWFYPGSDEEIDMLLSASQIPPISPHDYRLRLFGVGTPRLPSE